VEESFKEYFTLSIFKVFQSVPILVAWGIWLAHNDRIFEGKVISPL
jgi:hypothetical protein